MSALVITTPNNGAQLLLGAAEEAQLVLPAQLGSSLALFFEGERGAPGEDGEPGPPGSGNIDGAFNDNVGGLGWFKNEAVGILHFYGIDAASSKVTVTLDVVNDKIDIDVVEANLTLANLSGNLLAARISDFAAAADLRVTAGINTHLAAGDPHPQYLTSAEGIAAFSAIGHTHLLAVITDVTMTVANLNALDDGVNTALHFHDADRARANHTGTQLLATLSDVSISAANLNALDDGVNTALHFHDADRARANHTGTQLLATLSDVSISAANLNALDDGVNTALHFHDADRARANHTGTQLAATISDFAATVRTTVLTGLSLASSTVIAAGDTVLAALGQLQAQVTLRALAARALTASTGLTGGGDLTADRSFAIDKATDANVRAAASNKVVTSDRIESASAFVALTINTTPSPDEVTTNGTILDWDAFINATLTHTANMTLINPSNGQPGTWRSIAFTQHSSPVTITLGNQYKTVGAAGLVVSTGSGEKDMLNILCVSTTEFWLFHSKDMS